MKELLADKDLLKWVVNQGVSFLVLTVFTVSFMFLSFKYVPIFVGHVGNLADSTSRIDMHLADMVHDTQEIKEIDNGIAKKVESIERMVRENNSILKILKR